MIKATDSQRSAQVELERTVLGSCILFGDGLYCQTLIRSMDPTLFTSPTHRLILHGAKAALAEHGRVDLTLVSSHCPPMYFSEIADLMRCGAAESNLPAYTRVLRSKQRLRKLGEIGGELVSVADDGDMPPHEVAAGMIRKLHELTDDDRAQSVKASSAFELWGQIVEEEARAGRIQFGIEAVDSQIKGALPGMFMLLAGESNAGKSAFGMEFLLNCASQENPLPGLFMSLEMGRNGLIKRAISAFARSTPMGGVYAPGQHHHILSHQEAFGKLPLHFDWKSRYTLDDLYSSISERCRKDGVKVCVIDYAQLITVPGVTSIGDKADEISSAMRALSSEHNVLILMLVRYSGKAEVGVTPRNEWIYGGAAWTYAADVVLHLRRENELIRDQLLLWATKGRDIDFPSEPIKLFLDIPGGLRFS